MNFSCPGLDLRESKAGVVLPGRGWPSGQELQRQKTRSQQQQARIAIEETVGTAKLQGQQPGGVAPGKELSSDVRKEGAEEDSEVKRAQRFDRSTFDMPARARLGSPSRPEGPQLAAARNAILVRGLRARGSMECSGSWARMNLEPLEQRWTHLASPSSVTQHRREGGEYHVTLSHAGAWEGEWREVGGGDLEECSGGSGAPSEDSTWHAGGERLVGGNLVRGWE